MKIKSLQSFKNYHNAYEAQQMILKIKLQNPGFRLFAKITSLENLYIYDTVLSSRY